MRSISEFVVNKRYLVLGIMVGISIICAFLIPHVNINTDMTKYLPDNSLMKQGMDIMEAEFDNVEMMQTIRVMFKGIDEAEKKEVQARLEAIPNVDSVAFKLNSEDYNKGDYTLYVINTTFDYGSAEERGIKKAVPEVFVGYDVIVKSDNMNENNLTAGILALAIGLLFVILFVMCPSWLEPLIFLLVIGAAILINMGTNFMMGSVSNTTFSIAAILQLVLSMDYSIILMNRYRQEQHKYEDRRDVMKSALRGAFSSITSSAVTTFVGLLMLVFMNFKIGMDLGLVLAKGVLCSLVCIFTMLPGLILLLDKAIHKTAKKVPHTPMGGVSGFSYRLRRVLAGVFIVSFVVIYFIQTTTQIKFTIESEDPIAEIFVPTNTIVMLYNNDDTDKITALADTLDKNLYVKSAVSYPSVLGNPYTAADMLDFIKDMDNETEAGMELDSAMLKLLYYDYYSEGELPPVRVGELIRFIADDIVTNPTFSEYLDKSITENIEVMRKLADSENLERAMSPMELADFFGMNEKDAKQLFLYYYTKNGGVDSEHMTLAEFASFIKNDVLTDPGLSSMMPSSAGSQIDDLVKFSDANMMTTPYGYSELASLLGMNAEDVKLLYVYYNALQDDYRPRGMTISEFVDFVRKDVAASPMFSTQFPAGAMEQMNMLVPFTDKRVIENQLSDKELAQILGMDSAMIEVLYSLYHGSVGAEDMTMTLPQFTGMIAGMIDDSYISGQFTNEQKAQLRVMNSMMQAAASGQKYTAEEMAKLLGFDAMLAAQVYSMYFKTGNADDSLTMTLYEFTNYLVNTLLKDPIMSSFIDDTEKQQLITTHQLVSVAADHSMTFNATQLAGMIGLDENMVKMMFALSVGSQIPDKTMSPKQFVEYLLSDIAKNPMFTDALGGNTAQLGMINTIMRSTLTDEAYSYSRIAELFGMDGRMMKMLFTLHESYGDIGGWKLTMQQTVNFIASNKEVFASLQNGSISELTMAQRLINEAVENTYYTSNEMADLLGMDISDLDALFLLYTGIHGNTEGWQLSPRAFVDFVSSDVLSDKDFSDQFGGDEAESLKVAKILIDAVVSGKAYSTTELHRLMSDLSGEMDASTVELMSLYYNSAKHEDVSRKLSPEQIFTHLSDTIMNDPRFVSILDDDMRASIKAMKEDFDEGISQMVGENHSILMISSTLPAESPETTAFLDELHATCSEELSGRYYLIGNSPMNYEMENSFDKEMLLITILTALSIFMVVAITFRSLAAPTILVLIVQCAVFITVAVCGLMGYGINYLALLIVQSILMGATIDYGLVFTTYYREARETLSIEKSLLAAYDGSIHTIMTSGLIMIMVTGIMGLTISDPTIGQICQTISIGALAATLLILFILPGLLASFDRFVTVKKKRQFDSGEK